MSQFDVSKYEFKSPCYTLSDRNADYNFNEEVHKKQSRFYYDEGEHIYKSKEENKDIISMMFVGDLLCQEGMNSRYSTGENSFNFEMCFDYLRPLFQSCDFTGGNLETPIADTAPYRGEIITHEGPFFCNAPIQYLEALKYAGFDMLTTANNHTLDAGSRGIYETLKNVRKFDFIQTGTFADICEKFVIVDICGFKIGFTAFSLSYNSMDGGLLEIGKEVLLNVYSRENAESIYAEMKNKGAEYVICFPHWGKEYTHELSEKQKKISFDLTEIGYDCILGCHAHFVQKFEYINGKPVLFGLGNLISHLSVMDAQLDSQFTVICNLKLSRRLGEIIPEITFIPCQILKGFRRIPYTVIPYVENIKYSEETKERIKDNLPKFKTFLEVSDEQICTKYEISNETMDVFFKQEERQAELISQLAPVHSTKITKTVLVKELLEKENKRFRFPWRKKDKYEIYQDNLIKICEDHVVLTDFTTVRTVVTLPEKINDLPLTIVSNRQSGNQSTRYLYIGKKIEVIEEKAFQNFEVLESVRFMKGLHTIKAHAFSNCPKLSGLIMPATLLRIEEKAFENCKNLRNVTLKKKVEYIAPNAFSGCDNIMVFCYKKSYAEEYCKKNHIKYKNIIKRRSC